jgi:hypothetical protein
MYGDGRKWIAWPSPEYETVLRPTDWNDYLLIVEGNHYIARLNGVVILDFTDPTPKSFDGYSRSSKLVSHFRELSASVPNQRNPSSAV